MEQDAVKLYLKEGTVIEVLFDDGITKRYDMEKLFAKYPWVSSLKVRLFTIFITLYVVECVSALTESASS